MTFCYFTVAFVLLFSPRGQSAKGSLEDEVAGYDDAVTQRSLTLFAMLVACTAAVGGVARFHQAQLVFTKPIDNMVDICATKGKTLQ